MATASKTESTSTNLSYKIKKYILSINQKEFDTVQKDYQFLSHAMLHGLWYSLVSYS